MRRPPSSTDAPDMPVRTSLFEEQARAHVEDRRGFLRWAASGPMPLLRN